MLFDIHPEAIKHINKKAEALLGMITQIQISNTNVYRQSEFFISANITNKDIIGEMNVSSINNLEEEVGRYFAFNDKQYGLIDDGYKELIKIAEIIHKNKEISNYLSFDYIKNCLFSWVKDTYKKSESMNFTDFLLKKSEEVIDNYEILIPVPFTAIQRSFKLGEIEFIAITENMINGWIKQSKNLSNDEDIAKNYKLKLQHKFQGYAAGSYKCKAEKKRAAEIAYYNLSNSLSVLRLFSPANHLPELLNGAYEYGQNMVRKMEYFCLKGIPDTNNYRYAGFNQGVIDKGLDWTINSMIINFLNEGSELANYNKLLCVENPNKYQEKLIEVINIYSKNTLRYEIYDKLLYILVALESIFLRNDTEPIQQNVGERMAFLIGHNADERKDIVKTLRYIYSIRSKFIHHGESSIAETDLLRKFMNYAWLSFSKLVVLMDKYKTKDELLNDIDILKFS